MENKKPDYYISKKRKIVDFLIGVLISILIWAGGMAWATLYGDPGRQDSMGALIFLPVIIVVFFLGIWLLFRPKRTLILKGGVLGIVLPYLLFIGYCSILPLVR